MIHVFPAESRHTNDHGWLLSNFSFSFADYYDPNNMSFGPLRVFNDDFVQPLKGFGTHPHRDMEIVSVVLKGQLQHADSTGNSEIIVPGQVQRMSAGTGLLHSEMNPSPDEEVNFLQLWFIPEKQGLPPSYETITYDLASMRNSLLPIVSHTPATPQVAKIHQDMTIYLSDLEKDHLLGFTQEKHRRIYLFVIEGSLTVGGSTTLKKRDAARISDLHEIDLKTTSKAKFMLIDLP